MKAAVHTQYGSPDVLRIKEVDKPVPKDNEVLIRVYATTVNRTDCAMLRAKPFIMRFFTGIRKPGKQISGTDFAGKVEAVGRSVTSFKAGDKVFGFDDSGSCSHAQYTSLSKDKAISTMPANISYAEAAASLEGAHYALNFINKVALKNGDKVLVNGAGGAIGAAAVQLLKYFGAEVTAVCHTKDVALVKSIGADTVIDYTKEDFTANAPKQYHYVFDTVGKSSFARCKPLLKAGGVYMSSELGPMVQNPFLALITPIIGKKKVVFPIPTDIRRSILFVKKLIEERKFKAVIDREYPLEAIAEAYSYVERGEKTGNVIITMEDHNH